MKSVRWYLLGAALGIVGLVAWWATQGEPRVVIDLVDELPRAVQQRPSPEAFRVEDISVAGVSRRSIYVAEQSRLVYAITVPDGGWLRVALGVREEVWNREGNGVLFMAGVSHSGKYEELVSLVVNPFANPSDRQWLPVLLDLSPWAGQSVELVLNTRIAHPEASAANHLALWGAPAIVTR
ncbi:MAG: hypothetical protein AB7L71_12680 [Vicinamibacterales bacterium]